MSIFEAACDIYPDQYLMEPRPRCLDGVARHTKRLPDGSFCYESQTGRKYFVEEL